MEKLTVYGLPLNPTELLGELEGASFCVSYGTREKLGERQLAEAIARVGAEGLLMVDNGAFSLYKRGEAFTERHLLGYMQWAQEILDECPQAIAVIPDVIGGTPEQNAQLIREWPLEIARSMPVWHLDEPISSLLHRCDSGAEWLAFGSSGQYWKPGTPSWHARVREAFAAIDEWERGGDGAYIRPRIHMMRAQAFAHLYPFDSSDSTNLAINHNRQRKVAGESFKGFAQRLDAKIQASAGPACEHQLKRPMLVGYHFEIWDALRRADLRAFAAELAELDKAA